MRRHKKRAKRLYRVTLAHATTGTILVRHQYAYSAPDAKAAAIDQVQADHTVPPGKYRIKTASQL